MVRFIPIVWLLGVLAGTLGCVVDYPTSFIYEEIEAPRVLADGTTLRVMREGPQGKETVRCVDIACGKIDYRLWVWRDGYSLEVAQDKQVVLRRSPVGTKRLAEYIGIGAPEWNRFDRCLQHSFSPE